MIRIIRAILSVFNVTHPASTHDYMSPCNPPTPVTDKGGTGRVPDGTLYGPDYPGCGVARDMMHRSALVAPCTPARPREDECFMDWSCLGNNHPKA